MIGSYTDKRLRATILREFLNLFENIIDSEILEFDISMKYQQVTFMVNRSPYAVLFQNTVELSAGGVRMISKKKVMDTQRETNIVSQVIESFAKGYHKNILRRHMVRKVENAVEQLGGLRINRQVKNAPENSIAISLKIKQQAILKTKEVKRNAIL